VKKAMYPAVLIGVVIAAVACGGAPNATTTPSPTAEEASLAVNGSGEGAELDSSTSDAAGADGNDPAPYTPDTSQIESDLAEVDGDLAELDAELNEGSSELGRTEANPGE
jgi:hypothetical protein